MAIAITGKTGAWIALVAIVLLPGSHAAYAADQPITGKKLVITSGKLVVLSKDPSISIVGSNPVGPVGSDSGIEFADIHGPVESALPASNWSTNGAGTLFKFKNKLAPVVSLVKIAKLGPGLLKAVATQSPFGPVPNGDEEIDVVLSLDGGTNVYCMSFFGTGDGSTFLAKNAPAPGTCP